MSDNSNNNQNTSHEHDSYACELTRTLLLHTDNLFHQRVNIFLVAEAIFFAAIGSVWCAEQNAIKFVLCTVGLFVTIALWWTLLRLKVALEFWVEKFKSIDDRSLYIDCCKLGQGRLGSIMIFVWIIPVVTTLSWLVVLFLLIFWPSPTVSA